jgi:Na+-transporting methylmalonyl-CoA/oxaloacetate decarboxylase gamma subunit
VLPPESVFLYVEVASMTMTIGEAVTVGLFCMAVVFSVLIMLWGAVAAFGIAIRKVESIMTSQSDQGAHS